VFDDEMLTIDDLAAYLKLKPQTIYKWAQSGKIPGAKFGKEWRFRRSAIEQWIDSYIPGADKTKPSGTEKRSSAKKSAGEDAKTAATSIAGPPEDRKGGQGASPPTLSLPSRIKSIDGAVSAVSRDEVLERATAPVEKVAVSRRSARSTKRDRGPESN
jgi:excisionase family DNA binding protein